MFEISGFSESLIRCCVRCPALPFGSAGHAEIPDGSSRLLVSTIGFRSSCKVLADPEEAVGRPLPRLQPCGGCCWAHPPLSKIKPCGKATERNYYTKNRRERTRRFEPNGYPRVRPACCSGNRHRGRNRCGCSKQRCYPPSDRYPMPDCRRRRQRRG